MSLKRIIGVSEAHFGQAEKDALCRVIDTGWISLGEEAARFEQTFAQANGHDQAVSVSSCTAGLHLVLHALGVGAGDEVLVPGLTFIATINAVLYVSATPVPVDIVSLKHPHMSQGAARRLLSQRTKAVIVMPYGGYALDMKAWSDFCEEHSLLLITDAAHAAGLPDVARHGDATVFSFFANKNMTTAEGGMILAKRPETLAACRSLRGHAMTTQTLQRQQGHAYSYDVTDLGYNYRLDDLRAALGLVQLERLESGNARRLELAAAYRHGLGQRLPEILIPFAEGHPSVGHLMPVVLPVGTDRQALMASMRDAGVQTSIHYPPYHRFTWHGRLFENVSLPLVEEYVARCLTLPLHVNLDETDVETVIQALEAILRPQPQGVWTPAAGRADYHACLQEGFAALQEQQVQPARDAFNRALGVWQHSDAARAGLAATLEPQAAGDALWRLLEANPACPEGWDALATNSGSDDKLASLARRCALALNNDS